MHAHVYRDSRRRKDGRKPWCLSYEGLDGRRHREATDAPTKELAEKLLAAKLAEIVNRRVNPTPDLTRRTLADFAPEYLKYTETRGLSANYQRLHKTSLVRHLIPEFGSALLDEIHPGQIEKYIDRRLGEPSPNGGTVKPATVFQELMCLSALFRQAIARRHARTNPVKEVRKPHAPNQIERYLEAQEEVRLLQFAPQSIRPIIQTALHTGLRRGELLNLTWADVDLEARLIIIRPKGKATEAVETWAPKRNKVRTVPINGDLEAILKAVPKVATVPYVFVHPSEGRKWYEPEFSLAWYGTLKLSGVAGLRFHDLRHTFASRLVQAGVSLPVVGKLLGHASVAVTERYAHLAPSNLVSAVDVLSKTKNARNLVQSWHKTGFGGVG